MWSADERTSAVEPIASLRFRGYFGEDGDVPVRRWGAIRRRLNASPTPGTEEPRSRALEGFALDRNGSPVGCREIATLEMSTSRELTTPRTSSRYGRPLRFLGWGLLWIVLLIVLLWCGGTILFSNLPFAALRIAAAGVFTFVVPVCLLRFVRSRHGLRIALVLFFAFAAGVWGWSLLISPSHDRSWVTGQTRLPFAEFEGHRVTVRNVRDALHGPVGVIESRYGDREFDLRQLKSVDFVMSRFSSWDGLAHTFLTFGFDDGRYLSISVETRKEVAEEYSPLKGLFKQYELLYVVADERDVIGSRCDPRGEEVYVYPTRAERHDARALFVNMLKRANALRQEPEFYDTLSNNCTTNILRHIRETPPFAMSYDWRILFPGYADGLAYELGWIDSEFSLEETRRRYHVNDRARAAAKQGGFSSAIRRAD